MLRNSKRPPGRLLVVCPHVDDASECMGGSILKFLDNDWTVDILFMVEDEGVTNIVEANSIKYGYNYKYLHVDGKTFNTPWLNEHPGLWEETKDHTKNSPYHSKQRRRLGTRGGAGSMASIIRAVEIAAMAPKCDCDTDGCHCEQKPYSLVAYPNPHDWHEDNNITHKACYAGLRNYKGGIMQYEYPKYHTFNGAHGTFVPNAFNGIDEYIEEKLRWCKTFTNARSNYSEDQPFDHDANSDAHYLNRKNKHQELIDTIESHAAMRGHHTPERYSESFKWTQCNMNTLFEVNPCGITTD